MKLVISMDFFESIKVFENGQTIAFTEIKYDLKQISY